MPDDIVLGAKTIPNPKNIEPKLDTEVSPKATPNKFVKMDISNPPQSDVVPREHPVESLFQKPKTVRHQLGHHVPLKISNN